MCFIEDKKTQFERPHFMKLKYLKHHFRLCEEHYNIFDQHINNVHFQECLKRLMCAYDELNCLCDVKNDGKDFYVDFLVENRPYFESLYILLNLGNGDAITRGLGLSKIWKFVL